MPLHGEGEDHVVGEGDGIGLEELEELAEHPARNPAVHDLPDHLAYGREKKNSLKELLHSFCDWQPVMGKMVTRMSARVMWKNIVQLRRLPRVFLVKTLKHSDPG